MTDTIVVPGRAAVTTIGVTPHAIASTIAVSALAATDTVTLSGIPGPMGPEGPGKDRQARRR